jgi:translation initiation factor IF-3
VKITMRFRGREVTHQDLGMRVLMRVSGDLAELGKVEQRPTLEGRQMTMVLAPLVQPGEKAEGADKAAEKA